MCDSLASMLESDYYHQHAFTLQLMCRTEAVMSTEHHGYKSQSSSPINSTVANQVLVQDSASSHPPQYIMYAPGPVQGTFFAVPVSSPATTSIPVMPSPPQMFFTPTATPVAYPQQTATAHMGNSIVFPSYGHLIAPSLSSDSRAVNHVYAPQPVSVRDAASPPKVEESHSLQDGEDDHSSLSAIPADEQRHITAAKQSNKQSLKHSVIYLAESSKRSQVSRTSPSPPSSSSKPVIPGNVSVPSGTSAAVLSRVLLQSAQQSRVPSKGSSLEKLLTSGEDDMKNDPLLVQLRDEPHLLQFYRRFRASKYSNGLRIRVLNPDDSCILKWIEITRKASHIDPTTGPLDVARILISSHGLCKFQLLIPFPKTIFTKFMPTDQGGADALLSELSPQHALCPGLPNYEDKFSVLGYHPAHVRVLNTPHVKRYDHEKCPSWHIPSSLFSKSGHLLHNMCKHCRSLQNNLVRLATKACEVDPAEREAWTDPSSNRPLAYMSEADREERYRKLRHERTQLLAKLKAYEERLGIGKELLSQACTACLSRSTF